MCKKLRPWFVTFILLTVLVLGADLREKTAVSLLSTTTVAMGTNNTKITQRKCLDNVGIA